MGNYTVTKRWCWKSSTNDKSIIRSQSNILNNRELFNSISSLKLVKKLSYKSIWKFFFDCKSNKTWNFWIFASSILYQKKVSSQLLGLKSFFFHISHAYWKKCSLNFSSIASLFHSFVQTFALIIILEELTAIYCAHLLTFNIYIHEP